MADEEKSQSSMPQSDEEVHQRLAWGHEGAEQDPVVEEMRKNRRISALKKMGQSSGHPDIRIASNRPIDPAFWWRDQNLPFDISDDEELKKLRQVCRFLYASNPTLASAIDLFASYPATEAEIRSPDKEITAFYTDLFLDENELDYGEYFVEVLTDYWIEGEAFPLGTFNESLGVWEDDELMVPDDIKVERSPFLKEPRLKMKLPEEIKEIINKRKPEHEFVQLMETYPELKNFQGKDDYMPISNVLMQHIRFKFPHHVRGVPIGMRAIRQLVQEEMLNSAQESVASRLYMPFILAKLGATAQELGTQKPWIPTQGDREDFMAALDAAMLGDFRMLIYHFAVDITSVFGRETIPDLSGDFDRIEEKVLQVFGLSKTAVSGASGGQTYAADALNLELVQTRLRRAQNWLKAMFRKRAAVVAEAQEHWDYEVRGGKRYPIMEEVLEVDPETGKHKVVQQPKLLIPELKFRTMSMKSEQDIRQFVEAAAEKGVPISLKTRFTNIPVDLEEEREIHRQEAVDNAIAEQETRKEVYLALKSRGLPIDEDLKKDFEPKIADEAKGEREEIRREEKELEPEVPEEGAEGNGKVVSLPRNKAIEREEQEQKTRPPESDERRAEMPKPAFKMSATNNEGGIIHDRWGNPLQIEKTEVEEGPSRLISGPVHVGSRRYRNIDFDKPLDEQG